jgi:hypothetical protein
MENSNKSGAKIAKIGAKWMPAMARRRDGVLQKVARYASAADWGAMLHLIFEETDRQI